MIETIKNAWKIPDLRRKLLFVVFALVIFRFGYAIYVPYVDTEACLLYTSRPPEATLSPMAISA